MITDNCVVCGKRAIGAYGHVHHNGKKISAGLCSDHMEMDKTRKSAHVNCAGCVGDALARDFKRATRKAKKAK
jgi:hypothetical protein